MESALWTDAAISNRTADLLRLICIERRPEIVVDLGTGEGRSLQVILEASPASCIWTVEDDDKYIGRVQARLDGVALARTVFLCAPLTNDGTSRWYRKWPLDGIPEGIDLLFVDGPIGHVGRYPALPFFLPKLSRHATIILDDCRRAGERDIFQRWIAFLKERAIPHRSEILETDRGLGRIDLGA